MEPNALLTNTTETAKEIVKELKPAAKQVNKIISLAVNAVVSAKYVGSKKSEIRKSNKLFKKKK